MIPEKVGTRRKILRILPESVRRTLAQWLDTALPQSCLLCGGDSHDLLCAACLADLPQHPPGCPCCAEPMPTPAPCGHCLAHPPHFDATFAALLYAFPADRLIQSYKYGGELALAPWFAARLAKQLPREFNRILPLPLHSDRLRARGFNQSAELARHLGKALQCPVDPFSCRRRRATPPQVGLPHAQRAANVRGAFECTGSYEGEHLLLVDDVMTTGATANECARTLKLHGAASVSVAIVARALRN